MLTESYSGRLEKVQHRRPKRKNDEQQLGIVEDPLAAMAMACIHLADACVIAEQGGDGAELAATLRQVEQHVNAAARGVLVWSENYPYRRVST